MTLKSDGFTGFYPYRDLRATTTFYERLGLEIARDQGSCVIFRVAAGGYPGFCKHADAPPKHPGLILTLVLDDVKGAYRQLLALGVAEAPPKFSARFGISHFFARDPSGYRLELQRFAEPLG